MWTELARILAWYAPRPTMVIRRENPPPIVRQEKLGVEARKGTLLRQLRECIKSMAGTCVKKRKYTSQARAELKVLAVRGHSLADRPGGVHPDKPSRPDDEPVWLNYRKLLGVLLESVLDLPSPPPAPQPLRWRCPTCERLHTLVQLSHTCVCGEVLEPIEAPDEPVVELGMSDSERETAREHLLRIAARKLAMRPLATTLGWKFKGWVLAAEKDWYAHAVVNHLAQEYARWKAIGKYQSPREASSAASRYWMARRWLTEARLDDLKTLQSWALQANLCAHAEYYERMEDEASGTLDGFYVPQRYAEAEARGDTHPYDGGPVTVDYTTHGRPVMPERAGMNDTQWNDTPGMWAQDD